MGTSVTLDRIIICKRCKLCIFVAIQRCTNFIGRYIWTTCNFVFFISKLRNISNQVLFSEVKLNLVNSFLFIYIDVFIHTIMCVRVFYTIFIIMEKYQEPLSYIRNINLHITTKKSIWTVPRQSKWHATTDIFNKIILIYMANHLLRTTPDKILHESFQWIPQVNIQRSVEGREDDWFIAPSRSRYSFIIFSLWLFENWLRFKVGTYFKFMSYKPWNFTFITSLLSNIT